MSKDDGNTVTNTLPEPTATAARSGDLGQFKIKVLQNGVPIGWFADGGSPEYWVKAVDEQDAIVWTQVNYNGSTYLKKSPNNYLSYRSNHVIYQYGLKIRDWATAAKWTLDGKYLLCVDDNMKVGQDGDGFYCNDQNLVEVQFVPV
jgi:hypothetical protein